jgi:hypothetical protein
MLAVQGDRPHGGIDVGLLKGTPALSANGSPAAAQAVRVSTR